MVQFAGEHGRDRRIANIDVDSATATVVVHEHDAAWLGGPPIQSNYVQPVPFAWSADDGFIMATERSALA